MNDALEEHSPLRAGYPSSKIISLVKHAKNYFIYIWKGRGGVLDSQTPGVVIERLLLLANALLSFEWRST